MSRGWKIGLWMFGFLAFALLGLGMFRVLFLNYVDNYELGYKFDNRTGEVMAFEHTGYVMTPPFVVHVHTIDLRPMQVCINANSRVLNCKLVKFNPEGLLTFVEWHGRGDYDGTGLGEVLKSYAYDGSGKNYPFLTVLRDLRPEEDPETTMTGTPAIPSAE